MTWVLTILGIVMLVILHELGHFAAAKAVGMRVERFSLFFPPTLFRIRRGETEYAIGAIPAGGYVKITGMNPEELGELDPEVARRAYYAQPPWKRIVVILAGPGVNIVIAFVLFWAVLFTGNLNGDVALGNINPAVQTITPTTTVQAIERGKPAFGVLQPGDRIVSIEGRRATVSTTMQVINSHRCAGPLVEGCRAATPVHLTVQRHGRLVNVAVYPQYNRAVGRMRIGVHFGSPPRSFGVGGAATTALRAVWHSTAE